MDDRPLSEAIAHAYFVARRTCDGTPARSAAGGPEAVLQALAGIYKRGQVAGVFSSNEEGEEMSAAGAWCLQSLKWQADVADTITPRTPATLNRALTLYTEFCSLCFEIGVLPRAIAAWAGVAGEDEPVPVAMSAREGKIARYRASQALESNCAECQRVACSGELDEDALAGSIRADDGDDRAWALASLQLAALQGAEALVAAKEEMPLLARMARSMPADRGEQVAQLHRTCARVRGESMSPRHSHAEKLAAAHAEATRADRPGLVRERGTARPAWSAAHVYTLRVVERPQDVTHVFPTGLTERERIRSRVIRPGYPTPPMAVEQVADQEIADARAAEASRREREEGRPTLSEMYASGREDEHGLYHAAQERERKLQDELDDISRGAGHTKRL